jgi:hypothetical protein
MLPVEMVVWAGIDRHATNTTSARETSDLRKHRQGDMSLSFAIDFMDESVLQIR